MTSPNCQIRGLGRELTGISQKWGGCFFQVFSSDQGGSEMKRTAGLAAGALTGVILLASAPAAFADSHPTPPGQQAAGAARPVTAGAVHQVANVRVAPRDAQEAARRVVNDAFKAAVDAATARFDQAMASAKTAAAKAAAHANRRADVASAIAARQAALDAIPKPAPKPTKETSAPRPTAPSASPVAKETKAPRPAQPAGTPRPRQTP